jgi:hypothetical protein
MSLYMTRTRIFMCLFSSWTTFFVKDLSLMMPHIGLVARQQRGDSCARVTQPILRIRKHEHENMFTQ